MANQESAVAAVDVMERVVDIDPIGAIYNVTNKQIEEFVESYLRDVKGIRGVETARLFVHNEGHIEKGVAPDLNFILFMDLNSEDIVSDINRIPQHLRKLMAPSSLQPSQKLVDALLPITKGLNLDASVKDNIAYAHLDLIKVLALMFAVKRGIHMVRVLDVKRVGKNNCVFMVAKIQSLSEKATVITDKYDRLTQMIREERY
jgi:hypothetical protein